ncbi:MAG: hypothetical protein WBK96_10730 [Candidatus Manganitrophaceae bacterium]
MNRQAVIDILNKAVGLEYAPAVMYQQHRLLVQGIDREIHSKFFKSMSDSSFSLQDPNHRFHLIPSLYTESSSLSPLS